MWFFNPKNVTIGSGIDQNNAMPEPMITFLGLKNHPSP